MNTKNKLLVFLLVAVMLAISIVPVSAQGKTPPNDSPAQLTPAQMKNAVVVKDGSAVNRSKSKGEVYRFADCDESNPEAACYFMVTGNGNFAENINSNSITPLAATTTLICGTPIYNGFGALKAVLKQRVGVTFWGTFGQTPVTLNWGDRSGTYANYAYSWSDLTGPNPNPGWGVKVSRTQTSNSTVGGLLTHSQVPGIILWQGYISNRLTIKSSGWYCS